MFNKFIIVLVCLMGLSACGSVPVPGNIDDATVFHWENNYVVMEKFIQDHKGCLGVGHTKPRSRMQNLMNPMDPYTIPKWDGMWATFESRSHKETGQRIAFSLPSNSSVSLTNSYRKCMTNLGYYLTYKR